MADDKSNAGMQDRIRINVHEDYELKYWSEKFGISKERLKELVAKHGVMVADIKKALGQ